MSSRRKPKFVAGVDLAVRRSAAASLPMDFGGDLRRLKMRVIEGPEFDLDAAASAIDRARRSMLIAARLTAFLDELGGPSECECIFFENYAFGSEYGSEKVAEVAGVCKAKLVSRGYAIDVLMIATIRKILLGKVPSNHPKTIEKRLAAGERGRIDAKKEVKRVLDAAGAKAFGWDKFDEYDALAVANAGVHERGGLALAQLVG